MLKLKQWFIEPLKKVDIQEVEQLFIEAVKKGNAEEVEKLINQGADPNLIAFYGKDCKTSALHYASAGGLIEVVGVLKDKGASVLIKDLHNLTSLHFVAMKHSSFCNDQNQIIKEARINKLEEMWELLESSENINDKNNYYSSTPLILALDAGNIELAQWLIKRGANISIGSHNYEITPLMAAVDNHVIPLEMVKELIDNGANVNQQDTNGRTALHYSVDSAEKAQLLIKEGADITLPDNEGNLPLHYARGGDLGIIINLLANEHTIDSQNKDGDTPLHRAIYCSNKEVVSLLVPESNLSLKNSNGRTALDIAVNAHSKCNAAVLEEPVSHLYPECYDKGLSELFYNYCPGMAEIIGILGGTVPVGEDNNVERGEL